jgi:hypothetical protein
MKERTKDFFMEIERCSLMGQFDADECPICGNEDCQDHSADDCKEYRHLKLMGRNK